MTDSWQELINDENTYSALKHRNESEERKEALSNSQASEGRC